MLPEPVSIHIKCRKAFSHSYREFFSTYTVSTSLRNKRNLIFISTTLVCDRKPAFSHPLMNSECWKKVLNNYAAFPITAV